MKKKNNISAETAELRCKAEERRKKISKKAILPKTKEELRRLVQELQTHKIELEMMNEELQQSRGEVKGGLKQYTDLYDFAPVGYFNLKRDGTICRANLTGSSMLGVNRPKLMNSRFGFFISEETRSAFNQFLHNVFESKTKISCEVSLLKKGNQLYYVHIDAIADSNGQECKMTMVDITKRKRAEEALRILSLRQTAILASISDIIIEVDNNKIYTWANTAGFEFFGDDVIGKEAAYYFEGEQVTYKAVQPLFNGSENIIYVESWQRRKDGKKRLLAWWCRVLKDKNGNVTGALSTARDITEQKKAESEIIRLNRVYALLSNTNQAIVRIHEQQKLLSEICRIAVDDGKFKMAWIGMVNHATNKVDVAAVSGVVEDYLEKKNINLTDEKHCQEPTGRAIKTSLHFILNDIEKYEQVFTWKENAIRLGFKSAAAFPIKVLGKVIGAFTFYSDETEFFQSEEINHLDEMAMDISFALEFIETETERKCAEEALKESEKKFRTVVEEAVENVFTVDNRGYFTYVNPSGLRTSGYSLDELKQLKYIDLVEPEYKQKVTRNYFRQYLERGASSTTEYPFRTKSGEIKWFNQNVRLIIENDEVKGFYAIARDITERRKAEEALRESEERFRNLYENATIGIYRTTPHGKIDLANSTLIKMLGYSSFEELAGRNLEKEGFEPEYLRSEFQTLIESDGEIKGFESAWHRKDGTTIYVRESARVIKDVNNIPIFYEGTVEDITERKLAEEQLKKSEVEYRNLFENANDPIIIFETVNETVLEVNAKACQVYGFLHDEFVGISFKTLTKDVERGEKQISTLVNGDQFPNFETVHFKKDGTPIDILVSASVIEYRGQKAIQSINRDITDRKRVEETLRESEERFRTIFNESPIGIELYNADGMQTTANKASLNMFGILDVSEIYGFNIFDGTSLDVEKREKLRRGELVAYQTAFNFEKVKELQQYKTDRIGKAYFDYIITPLLDAERKTIHGYLLQVQDITERKQTEERIRYQAALLESVNDAIVATDAQYRLTAWNAAAESLYGWKAEEVLGRNGLEIVCTEWPAVQAEKMRRTIAETGHWRGEATQIRKDGTRIPVEVSSITLRDDSGQITGYVSVNRDITERKRAEEEIIFQRNRFAQLFENSPIAIALLDDQDKVAFINESFSALFDYYIEEVKGKSIDDLIVPPEFAEEAKSYSDQNRIGNQINKEGYRKKKDGSYVSAQIIGVPITVDDRTIGSYGMYVDLTQRKNAEEEMKIAKELAEQSDKLKSEFLAQMSHEIRTPISIISGNVDYLNQSFGKKMDADVRDCFDGIDLASKRIIRTIDLILNMSELETTGYQPNFIKVDLNSEILNKLYQEHQRSAQKKGLELIYKCEAKDSEVIADEYSITQIFANLIHNAIKYTKKGKVEMLLRKNRAGNIMVEIKDTGVGISKEFLPKIFGPFVQEEQGYTRSYDGNGLGLTLVKNYCDINNASIEVESEKNVGSTFRVIFRRE